MMGDWQHVDVDSNASSALDWLRAKGLGTNAEKIIEVSGAESTDDLQLIDGVMFEEIVRVAELKLVSAKKLKMAITELQGETAQEIESPQAVVNQTCAPSAQPTPLQECVAICIDRSGSMRSPFNEITLNVIRGETKDSVAQRTRMEAVKAMFYAFRDRVESLGAQGGHHLGLIQFDNEVSEMLNLTPELDRFESIVDDVEPRGQTAIYSSIVEAARMLEPHFHRDSSIDLRILVLTDGQSNTGIAPEEALAAVNRIGAVVDAIIVGDRPDANLRKIVTASEGECYQISNLGEGFELLEAEGVASLRARRGGSEKPAYQRREMVEFGAISEKALTRGTAVQRAPALALDFASKVVTQVSEISGSASAATLGSKTCKRVMQEIKQLASGSEQIWAHSGEGVHVFPSPDSINFWRTLIEGPQGSPFEGGVFLLNVLIPDGYPLSAPQIVFETPIYHCNVSDSGKICLSLLQEAWNPTLSVPKALEAIRMMMKEPDTDNSLRQWIAELTIAFRSSNGADARYVEKATESTRQHASTTVEEWRQRWNC
eukprot:TRINITY_DN41808_c0_g1_i1.p1 TRINITY_DN41808_c0_g1~~TRINITY_DN41808_c0_g1_i1.p1  ORF type:complete len:565 (-),score=114.72 TRINITY_DN41808_c0_g1_i1:209-1840(-)